MQKCTAKLIFQEIRYLQEKQSQSKTYNKALG